MTPVSTTATLMPLPVLTFHISGACMASQVPLIRRRRTISERMRSQPTRRDNPDSQALRTRRPPVSRLYARDRRVALAAVGSFVAFMRSLRPRLCLVESLVVRSPYRLTEGHFRRLWPESLEISVVSSSRGPRPAPHRDPLTRPEPRSVNPYGRTSYQPSAPLRGTPTTPSALPLTAPTLRACIAEESGRLPTTHADRAAGNWLGGASLAPTTVGCDIRANQRSPSLEAFGRPPTIPLRLAASSCGPSARRPAPPHVGSRPRHPAPSAMAQWKRPAPLRDFRGRICGTPYWIPWSLALCATGRTPVGSARTEPACRHRTARKEPLRSRLTESDSRRKWAEQVHPGASCMARRSNRRLDSVPARGKWQ